MKNVIIVFVILFSCPFSWGQLNLVRNPGFEIYSNCPTTESLLYYASGWNALDSNWTFGGTYPYSACYASYCNACATSISQVSVPFGQYGFQYPHKGNGMVESRIFDDGSFGYVAYTYLQGRLVQTLVLGQSYCVTFYVVRGNTGDYAVNNIGAYLDGGYIDTTSHCYAPQTEYSPQIVETAIISDTLNWTKIQGSFVANGTEKFITIGDFFDTAHIAKIHIVSTGTFAYYLIDDVSVIASDALATAGPDEWMGEQATARI